jgi:hypothetical protein
MNIFATSSNPRDSARWLDDVRKRSQLRESVQLLSTAVRLLDPDREYPVYRVTHENHPCSVWVRRSAANFCWLLEHAEFLHDMIGQHKSGDYLPTLRDWVESRRRRFPDHRLTRTGLTPFANCAARTDRGFDFRDMRNTQAAYRAYLLARWRADHPTPVWTMGEFPPWLEYPEAYKYEQATREKLNA